MANVSSFSGAMPVIPGGEVEVARVTRTTDYTVSATSLAGAADVFSPALTFVADGSTYIVEFYCEFMFTGTTAGSFVTGSIVNSSGTEIAKVASVGDANGTGHGNPVLTRFWYTPSAGSTTINFRAWRGTSNGLLRAASPSAPMYLRVVKPVNQNDGLKPFWTPPVVTQLPSQATVGDSVLYAADATNGIYWQLQYDGIGTYPWKFIGGSELASLASAGASVTSTTYAATPSGGPDIVIPVAGDYRVRLEANMSNPPNGTPYYTYMSFAVGATAATDADGMAVGWSTAAVSGGGVPDMRASRTTNKTITAASTTLSCRYRVNAGTGYVSTRGIFAMPIRVSA